MNTLPGEWNIATNAKGEKNRPDISILFRNN